MWAHDATTYTSNKNHADMNEWTHKLQILEYLRSNSLLMNIIHTFANIGILINSLRTRQWHCTSAEPYWFYNKQSIHWSFFINNLNLYTYYKKQGQSLA